MSYRRMTISDSSSCVQNLIVWLHMNTHYPSAIPNLELSAAWHLYEVILRQDTLTRLDVRRPSNRAWNATCCFRVLKMHRGSCFASVWTTKLKHGGRCFFRSKCELVWIRTIVGLVSRYDSNFSPWSYDFLCGTSTDDLKLWNFARTFGPSLSPWSTQRWNWKSPSFWHRRLRWWLWPSCSAPWRRTDPNTENIDVHPARFIDAPGMDVNWPAFCNGFTWLKSIQDGGPVGYCRLCLVFSLIRQAFRPARSCLPFSPAAALKYSCQGVEFLRFWNPTQFDNPLSPGAEQQGITIGCRWTRTLGAFAGDLWLFIWANGRRPETEMESKSQTLGGS